MSRVPLLAAVALGAPLIFWFWRDPRPTEAELSPEKQQSVPPDGQAAESLEETDPIWANAACYVCHTLFVKEEVSKVHLEGKVTCITCHGLSAAHANDEDIGATPPDIAFEREQIEPLCRRCHPTHDAPAQKVVDRFLQRRLSPKLVPLCTDCHGEHKIEQPADE